MMETLPKEGESTPWPTRGNLAVILAFVLTGVFAIAGLAIDTTLYLLKRQEVQTLAESVALSAAMSLPDYTETVDSAKKWYEILRIQDGVEIAETAVGLPEGIPLKVIVASNGATAGVDTPLAVNSVSVQIRTTYIPNILKVPGLSNLPISVVGAASAQLAPTDVVMIVENSASFYKLVDDNVEAQGFVAHFGGVGAKKPTRYWSQCFNPDYADFKRGVVELYDLLSQIGTFRVAVIMTNSKDSSPYVLANFGETALTGSRLENDDDLPDSHSTRCAVGTGSGNDPVPSNLNSDIWAARTDLNSILVDPDADDLSIASDTTILTREALWIQEAGYSTTWGKFNPRYFYSDPRPSLNLAKTLMSSPTRADNLPVSQRVILWLTDGPGAIVHNSDGTLFQFSGDDACSYIKQQGIDAGQKVGIIYYGHTEDYFYHSWDKANPDSDADDFRQECMARGNSNTGMFFVENSPFNLRGTADFANITIPLVGFGLKQAELVE